jgi:hypothetical protein
MIRTISAVPDGASFHEVGDDTLSPSQEYLTGRLPRSGQAVVSSKVPMVAGAAGAAVALGPDVAVELGEPAVSQPETKTTASIATAATLPAGRRRLTRPHQALTGTHPHRTPPHWSRLVHGR